MFLNLVYRHKDPISLIRLHKLMFLFFKSSGKAYYCFIPNKYGCYSICLHNDQEYFLRNEILVQVKGVSPFDSFISIDSDQIELDSIKLKKEDSTILDQLIFDNDTQTDDDLIEKTYKAYPFYGIRSLIIDRFSSDKDFMSKLHTIINQVTSSPRFLYTIGYEGLSIDRFMQLLIVQNIKTLVDVRKNPFSMRQEYRKKNLENSLSEAGIKYYHMPEVGIPSSNRKELLPSGRRCDLFRWYAENTLPLCEKYAADIAGLVDRENIALMCYEKDPKDCHRSLFADYCQQMQNTIPGIKHIVGADCVKTSIHNSPNVSNTFA